MNKIIVVKCLKCKIGRITEFFHGSYRCENCGLYFGLYDSREIESLVSESVET